MVVRGQLERPSKFEGKPYLYDFDTDGLYIELRHGSSEYSDMTQSGDIFYVLDYDRDGNVIGVTVESVLSRAARRELSARIKIALILFRMRLIPAAVIAKMIANNLRKIAEKLPTFEPKTGLRPAYM